MTVQSKKITTKFKSIIKKLKDQNRIDDRTLVYINNLTLEDTSKQALRDIKSEAMWGAVGQSLPGLKPFITRMVLKKQQGKLVADDIKQAHEASKRIGVDLFPVDVSGKLGQMYAKVIGIFPWVGKPLKQAGTTRAESLNKIQNQYLYLYFCCVLFVV